MTKERLQELINDEVVRSIIKDLREHDGDKYAARGLADYDDFVDKVWFADARGYDRADRGGMPEFGYLALGIAGESGEFADKVKKIYRDGGGPRRSDVEPLAKELGDILYYVTRMAHLLGLTLDQVAKLNRDKLCDRLKRGKLYGEGDDR